MANFKVRKHKQKDIARPFRLWDATAKKPIPWRCYGSAYRALRGAVIEIHWSMSGTTIEVYDIRTMVLYGQFTMKVNGDVAVYKPVEVKREK